MCDQNKHRKCSFCGKQFSLNSCLKIHEVKHNREVRNSRLTTATNSNDKLNAACQLENVEGEFDGPYSGKNEKIIGHWNYRFRKIHQCSVCGRQFKVKGNLKTHFLHHVPVPMLSCIICEKKFSCVDYFKTHTRKHDTKITLQCPNCKRIFYNQETYKRHVSKGLKSDYVCIRRAFCTDCKEVFLSDELLKEHLSQKSYHCQVCQKLFSSCETFKNHVKFHTLKCLECDRVFASKEEWERHEVVCPVCQKKCESHALLKRHLRNHLGKERHQCEICGKICNKQSFKMHMRRHRGDTPYKCEECGASFVIEHYLRKHMKTHSGLKDFSCEICNKKFNQKQNLKRHYRIHSEEKPYKCQLCLKKFKWSDLLVKHLKKCDKVIGGEEEEEEGESLKEVAREDYAVKEVSRKNEDMPCEERPMAKCEKVACVNPEGILTCNKDLEDEALSLDQITLFVPKLDMKVERVSQEDVVGES